MSTRNTLPVMTEQALLTSIGVLLPDLAVELRDIKNPTSQFILNFYAAVLSELGVDINELCQIQMKQMTVISHVDMYSQTVPHLNLYDAMNYFFKQLGINDFSFSDIVNPNPKRTLVQLSVIMTFLQYCDVTVSELMGPLDQLAAQKKKKEALLSKIESLKKDINQRATNRVKRNEVIKETEVLIEKEKGKLDELFKEKETQKEAMDDIKRLIQSDENRETQYMKALNDLKEEMDKLSDMIVRSPDKLKHEWAQLEEKKDECVQTIKSLKEQIEEKKKLNNNLITERNEQESRSQKLQELLLMEKSLEEMNNMLDSTKRKQADLTEEVEELQLQIDNTRKTITTLKSTLEELKARKLKQDAEISESLDLAQKEYQSWLLKSDEKIKLEIELRDKIDLIQNNHEQLGKDVKAFNEYLEKEYETLDSREKEIQEHYEKILELARQRNQRLLEEDFM